MYINPLGPPSNGMTRRYRTSSWGHGEHSDRPVRDLQTMLVPGPLTWNEKNVCINSASAETQSMPTIAKVEPSTDHRVAQAGTDRDGREDRDARQQVAMTRPWTVPRS